MMLDESGSFKRGIEPQWDVDPGISLEDGGRGECRDEPASPFSIRLAALTPYRMTVT
jgi:hypothetical protein